MLYLADSPFGKVCVKVTVRSRHGVKYDGDHYDPDWAREVEISSARHDNLGGDAYEPCKVNRTEVRFAYSFSVRKRFGEPFNEAKKYDLAQGYSRGECYRLGIAADDAPQGAKDKLRRWVHEFLPEWMGEHPNAWLGAEHEGRVEEHKRLDAEVESLRKKINEVQQQANIMFCEAAELAKRFP